MYETDQAPAVRDSNRAKRQRVLQALVDPDLRNLSTRALAMRCAVSPNMISKMRRELSSGDGETGRPHQGGRRAVSQRLNGETLMSAGCTITLAQRIMSRLAAMLTGKRRWAEGVLESLII